MAQAKLKKKKQRANPLVDPNKMPERYAMECEGNCMSPEIENGTVLAFDRNAAYKHGDLIAIYFRPEIVRPGDHQVLVKRMCGGVPHHVKSFPHKDHPESEGRAVIFAEQINPPKRYAVRCSDILGIHKCIGKVPAQKKKVHPREIGAELSS